MLALATENFAAHASGRFDRNSVMDPPELAAHTSNGRFHGRVAASLLDWPERSAFCMSEGGDFNPTALGLFR